MVLFCVNGYSHPLPTRTQLHRVPACQIPDRDMNLKPILLGGLLVGVLDGLDAIVFFGIRGTTAARIFQAIASGLLGSPSFQGGGATVLLGVVLHFSIATGIVATYFAVSRRVPLLIQHPVWCGLAYGLVVYLVMNLVVVPLSAVTPGGPKPLAVLINGLTIHFLGVGLPTALIVAKAEKK